MPRPPGSRWKGDAEPAALAAWPEDSLGDRLWSDPSIRTALGVPPLREAQVPDPAVIRADPVQWNVALSLLVRAVVLDGIAVGDPRVVALLAVLGPVVEAELLAGDVAADEARRDGLEPSAVRSDFPAGDGPVFLVGCCALVHATWTAIGNDPLPAVLGVVSEVVERAVPGRGRTVAEVLFGAFGEHYSVERSEDVELVERLGAGTSGDPLRDLVSAGVVASHDVLRVGLEVLAALAELCTSSAVSVLDAAAPADG
ncbi:hypothetical protein GHK86_01855 [Acidimicrobiaceae bacterium USS-CC1]|uniref:Uncharacterized protein n=1 Tax=Acidiferrimicrobium australe TaxID=2664430 RepID=A0ABW9QPE6_9ACTN|nr:hypothetical protein [Acidiferrimicrobium australe]